MLLDVAAQRDEVRARNDAVRAQIGAAHPRDDGAVIEADEELGSHLDFAATSANDPQEIGSVVVRGHEVDQRDGAALGLEGRLENQGLVDVAATDFRHTADWRDPPAAEFGAAEYRGETGSGIEAWPAEPVDGAVDGDERGRLAVADEGVVLESGEPGHAGREGTIRALPAGRHSETYFSPIRWRWIPLSSRLPRNTMPPVPKPAIVVAAGT